MSAPTLQVRMWFARTSELIGFIGITCTGRTRLPATFAGYNEVHRERCTAPQGSTRCVASFSSFREIDGRSDARGFCSLQLEIHPVCCIYEECAYIDALIVCVFTSHHTWPLMLTRSSQQLRAFVSPSHVCTGTVQCCDSIGTNTRPIRTRFRRFRC